MRRLIKLPILPAFSIILSQNIGSLKKNTIMEQHKQIIVCAKAVVQIRNRTAEVYNFTIMLLTLRKLPVKN